MGHRVLATYGVTSVAASVKEELMGKDFPDMYEHLRELMGRLGAQAPGVMRGFAAPPGEHGRRRAAGKDEGADRARDRDRGALRRLHRLPRPRRLACGCEP